MSCECGKTWQDHATSGESAEVTSQIATKLRHTAVVVPRTGWRLPDTPLLSGPGPSLPLLGLVASISAVLYAKMAWTEHGSDRSPNRFREQS